MTVTVGTGPWYPVAMKQPIDAKPEGRGRKVAVAVARFNEEVTGRLLEGALAALQERGVAEGDIQVVRVPGAFELPLACKWLADSGRHDAVIALGAVIRGETDHYDYICSEAAAGVLRAGLDAGVPVALGVLTCATPELAMARAGGEAGNKGREAALAALEMAGIRSLLILADYARTGRAGAKTPPAH